MQDPRRQRHRPPRSCTECRRRKIKCSRTQPCSQCVLSKCRCLYGAGHPASQARPRRPAPPLPPDSEQRVLLPGINRELGNNSAVDVDVQSNDDNAVRGQDPPLAAYNHDGHGELKALTDRIQSLERSLAKYENTTSATAHGTIAELGPSSSHASFARTVTRGNGEPKIAEGPADAPLVLKKSRLYGHTHWSNAVHEFKKIAGFMRSEVPRSLNKTSVPDATRVVGEVVSLRTLSQQAKCLTSSLKTLRPGRFLSRPEPVVSDKDAADRFAQLYMSHFEPVFRMFYVPTFWEEYNRYWSDPAGVSDVTTLKVQFVVAIGTELCGQVWSEGNKSVRRTACHWVHAASDWLSAPFEKSRLNLDSIQVQCLLLLARQVFSVGSDLSWVSMGTLMRCAMQLGLHRDPEHFSRMGFLEAELRRKLWATILELNIQMSLDSGTPPGISCNDFDTASPANINDEDIDTATIGTALREQIDEVVTDNSLQRFLSQNLPTRLEMLHRMNGIGNPLTDEDILSLSAKMIQVCRECTSHLKSDSLDASTAAGDGAIRFKQDMTQLLLRRFILALHRPLAGRIHENVLYYHSRKVSFDTAAALLKPVTTSTSGQSSSSAVFSRLMIRGGGIFRHCLTHVSLALASELLIEIGDLDGEDEGGEGDRKEGIRWGDGGGSSAYRRLLVDTVEQTRDVWAERLRHGETNVHLHVKLSIVLGLVKEIERRTERLGVGGEGIATGKLSMQQRMAVSARESLETCIALIKSYHASDDSSATSLAAEEDSGRGIVAASGDRLDFSDFSFDFGDFLQTPELGVDVGAFDSNILLM